MAIETMVVDKMVVETPPLGEILNLGQIEETSGITEEVTDQDINAVRIFLGIFLFITFMSPVAYDLYIKHLHS